MPACQLRCPNTTPQLLGLAGVITSTRMRREPGFAEACVTRWRPRQPCTATRLPRPVSLCAVEQAIPLEQYKVHGCVIHAIGQLPAAPHFAHAPGGVSLRRERDGNLGHGAGEGGLTRGGREERAGRGSTTGPGFSARTHIAVFQGEIRLAECTEELAQREGWHPTPSLAGWRCSSGAARIIAG